MDGSQRDRYLGVVVANLYPERRIGNCHHDDQRQEYFPDVVARPALNLEIDFKLSYLLAASTNFAALLSRFESENFPLGQFDKRFSADPAVRFVVCDRDRVPLIEERLQEDLQRLIIKGERLQVE